MISQGQSEGPRVDGSLGVVGQDDAADGCCDV